MNAMMTKTRALTTVNEITKKQQQKYINRNVVVMPPPERRRKAPMLRYCWKQKSLLSLLVLGLLLYIVYIFNWNGIHNVDEPIGSQGENCFPKPMHSSDVPGMKGYLVWSENCKMLSLDPYLPDVMKFLRPKKYQPCKLVPPLTSVEFNSTSQRYIIVIDKEVLEKVGYRRIGRDINCCYQSITRYGTGGKTDTQIRLSDCISLFNGTSLDPTIDNILVECRVKKKRVYFNGHFLMPERPEIRERLNMWKTYDRESGIKEKPPSVLMLGIDSISRLHLIRAMPKTASYLYENEWFEMSGFNKIDDNSFPNLMAVLTGMNRSTAMRDCYPYKLNALDDCDLVWKTFRDHGYVTAYAEDMVATSTFNGNMVGFNETPVDYYLRPFLLAAKNYMNNLQRIDCRGYKHQAEFVFDYALELAKRYKNDSFFGLFWANSFSHDDFSKCTTMDDHIMEYLEKFKRMGTLNNTIVIFFSDHGIRFGKVLTTSSAHMEQRLPFVFLWLPPKLREAYPSFVNALNVNKNRLTNPYDMHMTLKHILSLSRRVKDSKRLSPSSACPKCQSLLEPVPADRSCIDAAIEEHWCTCHPYQKIYKNSKTVVKLTHLLVEYINNYVRATLGERNATKLCVPLEYDIVRSAYHATEFLRDANGKMIESDIYRVTFYTKPNKSLFEATAFYDPLTGSIKVIGEISRLNAYVNDSFCISHGGAKKYCSCRRFFVTKLKHKLYRGSNIMSHLYFQHPLGNVCIHDDKDRVSNRSGSNSNSNHNNNNNNNSRTNESKKQ